MSARLRALPVAARLRTWLKNVLWVIRGLQIGNPPLPPEVSSILFVCLGNICRSPFGALLAARLLAEAGRADVRCTSAGIRPSQDNRSPAFACQAAAVYGISLTDHVPQPLVEDMMRSHDMVIVMEWRQMEQLQAAFPQHRDRVFLLSLFDPAPLNAYERYNITDPFSRPAAAFEECYRRMDRALRRLVAEIGGAGPSTRDE